MVLKMYNSLLNIRSAKIVLNILFLLILLTSFTCLSKFDVEKARLEILAHHKAIIDAHWQKDAEFFTRYMAKDFLFVQNGEIQRPQKEDIIKRMHDYLANTTFTEYRDLHEPIIGFSKDGSVAWSIVQVKIAGKHATDEGTERDIDFTYAWITLYERKGDMWIRLAEVSNFR